MTDLEKLAQFTKEDVEDTTKRKWFEITKYCHRQNQTPKLYLIGGQPGAGKSTTISKIKNSMQGNCVIINLDDYRALHPNAREIYEKGALKKCETIGIQTEVTELPEGTTQDEYIAALEKLNNDASVNGILTFRPLPEGIDEEVIKNVIAAEKDVDCMTDLSMSGVFTGKKIGFPPCTPQACMEILDHYGIDCTGKKAVVIGRSLVVGKPAAMMLVKKNATVTICHTRTVDMPSVAREADIIIVAAGRAGVVGAEYVKEGQTIIDVGINVNAEGKLCGDVDYAAVEPIVDAITPVPGGVGSVTTSVLVGHVVEAAMRKVNA